VPGKSIGYGKRTGTITLFALCVFFRKRWGTDDLEPKTLCFLSLF
jgi:hypothetical protein